MSRNMSQNLQNLSQNMTPDDDDFPALRAPETGRRTDDAFARAVAAAVAARRGRFRRLFVAVPTVAGVAGAAVVVFALTRPGPVAVEVVPPTVAVVAVDRDAGVAVAVVEAVAAHDVLAVFEDSDDTGDGLLALADSDDDDDFDFAIPGLAGSSDRELEDIEAALDRALKL